MACVRGLALRAAASVDSAWEQKKTLYLCGLVLAKRGNIMMADNYHGYFKTPRDIARS